VLSVIPFATAYRIALEELADACRQAGDLAEVFESAAALLRGRALDLDESPPDLVGAASRLRQALARLGRARDTAHTAWESRSAEDREGLPSPAELLDVS
jgi:hypothetical protein